MRAVLGATAVLVLLSSTSGTVEPAWGDDSARINAALVKYRRASLAVALSTLPGSPAWQSCFGRRNRLDGGEGEHARSASSTAVLYSDNAVCALRLSSSFFDPDPTSAASSYVDDAFCVICKDDSGEWRVAVYDPLPDDWVPLEHFTVSMFLPERELESEYKKFADAIYGGRLAELAAILSPRAPLLMGDHVSRSSSIARDAPRPSENITYSITRFNILGFEGRYIVAHVTVTTERSTTAAEPDEPVRSRRYQDKAIVLFRTDGKDWKLWKDFVYSSMAEAI